MEEEVRPVGTINIHDPRGYSFIPRIVREELGIKGKDRIPFFIGTDVILLVRRGSKLKEILKGLEILIEILKARSKNRECNRHERTSVVRSESEETSHSAPD